jgi:hypothetical protein
MALNETTRVCHTCHTLIADPAAAQCDRCGRALCPHHSTWAPRLKWFLVSELLKSLFHPWKTQQSTWEDLLRDTFNGIRAGTRPNPAGVHITSSASAADLYPLALARSEDWKAMGSQLGPVDTLVRRSA